MCVMVLQLNKETRDGTLLEKHAVYQRANKEVNYVILKVGKLASLIFLTLNDVSPLLRLL